MDGESNMKEKKPINQKCVAIAKVRKPAHKEKVFSGKLSSTLRVYLYPPKLPGKMWGLGVGSDNEAPRIVTHLKETADGTLQGIGGSPWKAKKLNDNSDHVAWEILFSASKA
jgi:hypothetical protein